MIRNDIYTKVVSLSMGFLSHKKFIAHTTRELDNSVIPAYGKDPYTWTANYHRAVYSRGRGYTALLIICSIISIMCLLSKIDVLLVIPSVLLPLLTLWMERTDAKILLGMDYRN